VDGVRSLFANRRFTVAAPRPIAAGSETARRLGFGSSWCPVVMAGMSFSQTVESTPWSVPGHRGRIREAPFRSNGGTNFPA
jgi:hypothetical protein